MKWGRVVHGRGVFTAVLGQRSYHRKTRVPTLKTAKTIPIESPYCKDTHGPLFCIDSLSRKAFSVLEPDLQAFPTASSIRDTLIREFPFFADKVLTYHLRGRDSRRLRLGFEGGVCKRWLEAFSGKRLPANKMGGDWIEASMEQLGDEATNWLEAKPVANYTAHNFEETLRLMDKLEALRAQYEKSLRELSSAECTIRRFVCLDIEAYERAQRKLTEFGFAVYDRDTQRTQHYHVIIKEHRSLCNTHYSPNFKDKFEFGESMSLSTAQAMGLLEHLLSSRSHEGQTALVGHSLPCDLNFLKRAQITGKGERIKPSVLHSVPHYDLQLLHRCREYSHNRSSLQTVCSSLGITTKTLHNAGNDAAYTLEAFRKLMCIT